jgi:BirA family transcriptional regulator, biotin operon repressor / biotin---[acetyl-CoA-carboxylase] ligase
MSGFDLARFEAERDRRGLGLGRPLVWRDETASTNDDAIDAAKAGAAHGALFGAESQVRGRGRRGGEWFSPPGAGLWFSLVLRPELSAELTPGLALCAGLAVREAVATRAFANVKVKWPNDVLVERQKLAGILVESQVSSGRLTSVVIGVGINVEQREFPERLASIATSLALLEAVDRDRAVLLAEVLQGLEKRLPVLKSQGLRGVAAELRRYDALLGARLRVDGREGVGAGIDNEGRLLLQLAQGAPEPQLSGHVELLAGP